ncbi:hypothetical protein [Pseudotenacibaculum haliotis]|uniref:Uncharacterized protein n=1 Tax=Pseudotenacibaculum haliotis TaxID=1862138 RepID=A0ABW5LNM9_9FLAO
MNAKWYIGTLFLIFAYFGTFQEQASVPNQEIVLEFVDTKVDQKDIKSTIADVRQKLLKIGASNITIQETKEGTLKISYHSLTHTDDIKDALHKENQLVLNQNSGDKEENNTSLDYKIDVYELTDSTDISNHNDKFVFEIKSHSDRSTINYNYGFVKSIKTAKANQLFKTTYKAYKNNPFTKDYTSHKEPEVRAGPFTYNV